MAVFKKKKKNNIKVLIRTWRSHFTFVVLSIYTFVYFPPFSTKGNTATAYNTVSLLGLIRKVRASALRALRKCATLFSVQRGTTSIMSSSFPCQVWSEHRLTFQPSLPVGVDGKVQNACLVCVSKMYHFHFCSELFI